MNKVTGIFIVFVLVTTFCCDFVPAGTFLDLKPGVSKKEDADRVLGDPINEIIKGTRYDYSTEGQESKRISIVYDENGVITDIDLYFLETYSGDEVKEWFSLGTPGRTEYDQNGNLVEYYTDAGISLHHNGPDNDSPVIFFSHYYLKPMIETNKVSEKIETNTTPEAEKYFNKGRMLIESGKSLEAIEPLKKAVMLDPEDGVYRLALGTTYCELNQFDLAVPELEKALQLGPESDYSANHMLGIIYWMRKDHGKAIDHLEQALAAKPDVKDPQIYIYLGASYYDQRNYPLAKKYFLAAYDLDSRDPVTVYYLGACNDALRRKKDAVFFYNKYLQMGHNDGKMRRMAKQRMSALSGNR